MVHRAAKGLLALLLVAPNLASAQWPSLLQTRVRGSDQNPVAFSPAQGELSHGTHQAWGDSWSGIASGYSFTSKSTAPAEIPLYLRRDTPTATPRGEFSIIDWSGYPESLPRPPGPFRLLEGAEYEAAQRAANEANRTLHKADPKLAGKQIHEVKPVKFDGSPTDLANKLFLDRLEHARFTAWWNRLMRELQAKSPPPPGK